MSEFAREAVLASVDTGGGSKSTLGGDLLTLTGRLQELDKLLKLVSGVIGRVLGDGQEAAHPEAPPSREQSGGGGAS